MKKLFAILMLAVYLFNLAGHNFFFRYYISLADEKIIKEADNDAYSAADLREIKVKLNLPYLTDWPDYERYNGEIELDGIHYNYVKRRVFHDTLFVLCLPNEVKTELYKTKTDYALKANDLPSEKQNKSTAFKKIPLSEGWRIQTLQYSFAKLCFILHTRPVSPCPHIPDAYITAAGEPPELLS